MKLNKCACDACPGNIRRLSKQGRFMISKKETKLKQLSVGVSDKNKNYLMTSLIKV